MKKIILLIITLLWMAYWWRWYTCKICTTCGCQNKEIPSDAPIIPENGFLLFTKGDTIAQVQPGWAQYRDSILFSLSPNQYLNIEGQYTASEPNISTLENMGLARANEIRKLFPDSLFSKIKLTSLLIPERPTMNGLPFVANSFSITTQSEKIEQIGDKSIVYFNYNSDQRIKDQEIETYLSNLAANNKNNRSSFVITGHTDNTGDPRENMKLGLKRAETIKSYLMSKGIAAERIITKSLGDTVPLADNNTPEGRKKNRRTEIDLLNKQ